MRDPKADLEVCRNATPGMWEAVTGGVEAVLGHVAVGTKETVTGAMQAYTEICFSPENCNSDNDMKFIALAREALPYWINRAQELEEREKLGIAHSETYKMLCERTRELDEARAEVERLKAKNTLPDMYEVALKVALRALTNEYYNQPRKGLEKEYEVIKSALQALEGGGKW